MALFGGGWFEDLKHTYVEAEVLLKNGDYYNLIKASEYGINLLETHLERWPLISNLSKGVLIGNFYMFRAKAYENSFQSDSIKIKQCICDYQKSIEWFLQDKKKAASSIFEACSTIIELCVVTLKEDFAECSEYYNLILEAADLINDDECKALSQARVAMSLTAFNRDNTANILRALELYQSALSIFQNTGDTLSQCMTHSHLCRIFRHEMFANDPERYENILLHAKQALKFSEKAIDEEIAYLYGCIAYAYSLRRFGESYQNIRIGSLMFRSALHYDSDFVKREPFAAIMWIRTLLDNNYVAEKVEDWVDYSLGYINSLNEKEKISDGLLDAIFTVPINVIEDIFSKAITEIIKQQDYRCWHLAIEIKSDLGKKVDSRFSDIDIYQELIILFNQLSLNDDPYVWASVKMRLIDNIYHANKPETIKNCLSQYELISEAIELGEYAELAFEITLRKAQCLYKLGNIDKAYTFAVATMDHVRNNSETNPMWDERIFPSDHEWLRSLPIIALRAGHLHEALLYFDFIHLRQMAYTLEDLLTIDQQINRLHLFKSYTYYLQGRRVMDKVSDEKVTSALNQIGAIREQLVKLRDTRGISSRGKFYQHLEDFLQHNDTWLFIPMLGTEESSFILIPPKTTIEHVRIHNVDDLSFYSTAKKLIEPQGAGWAAAIHNIFNDMQTTQNLFENMEEYLWENYGEWLHEQLNDEDSDSIPKLCIIATGALSMFPFTMATRADGLSLLDIAEISYTPSLFAFYAINERIKSIGNFDLGLGFIEGGTEGIEAVDIERSLIASHMNNQRMESLCSENLDIHQVQNTLKDKSHWHIATHGKFEWSVATNSTLQIGDTQMWGGILVSLESNQLIRLVILSSCEAGLTDNIIEMSDPKGLPFNFLEIGALGTIGSLWKQSDEASALLMSRFYHYHVVEHYPPASALRLAQMWLRDANSSEIVQYLKETLTKTDLSSEPTQRLLEILNELPSREQPFFHSVFWAGYYLLGQ